MSHGSTFAKSKKNMEFFNDSSHTITPVRYCDHVSPSGRACYENGEGVCWWGHQVIHAARFAVEKLNPITSILIIFIGKIIGVSDRNLPYVCSLAHLADCRASISAIDDNGVETS